MALRTKSRFRLLPVCDQDSLRELVASYLLDATGVTVASGPEGPDAPGEWDPERYASEHAERLLDVLLERFDVAPRSPAAPVDVAAERLAVGLSVVVEQINDMREALFAAKRASLAEPANDVQAVSR